MNRKVSAYIPCYNAEKCLGDTLRGLFAQTHEIAEIIVVDDGSVDSTAHLASQFPVTLLRHSTNRGLAAARNTAIRRARHELIASVDADVVPSPTWLEQLLHKFTDVSIAGAGGRCVEQFQTTAADRWRGLHLVQDLGDLDCMITPLDNKGLSGFAAIFQKAAIQKVGGYNERYRTNWEDWDLSVRLREAGYALVYCPEAVAVHMRMDTPLSVVRTAWRWVFWEDYYDGSYEKLIPKLFINFRRAWKNARRHLERRDVALLTIDCLYLLCFEYWDIRFYLQRQAVRQR